MSMTLRLSEDLDQRLADYALRHKISKNEAVVRALGDLIDQDVEETEVRRIAREIMAEDGPLLDRLAQ